MKMLKEKNPEGQTSKYSIQKFKTISLTTRAKKALSTLESENSVSRFANARASPFTPFAFSGPEALIYGSIKPDPRRARSKYQT